MSRRKRVVDRVKLTELAAELKSYPRKLEGCCRVAGVTVYLAEHDGRRTRMIDRADVRKVQLLHAASRRLKGVSKGWQRDLGSIPSV